MALQAAGRRAAPAEWRTAVAEVGLDQLREQVGVKLRKAEAAFAAWAKHRRGAADVALPLRTPFFDMELTT